MYLSDILLLVEEDLYQVVISCDMIIDDFNESVIWDSGSLFLIHVSFAINFYIVVLVICFISNQNWNELCEDYPIYKTVWPTCFIK